MIESDRSPARSRRVGDAGPPGRIDAPLSVDLSNVLGHAGSSEAELVERVDRECELRPGDVLLAAGSLVEGLGNTKSDIDLILIRTDDADGTKLDEDFGFMLGRVVTDIRVLASSSVQQLTGRLQAWAGQPWAVLRLADFSLDERLLLHRLAHGRQIHPVGPRTPVIRYPVSRRDLSRLKLHIARHMARTIMVDMVGYRDVFDHASLVFAAQDLLGHAVDGLLAGFGVTNPHAKWRNRLLATLPDGWSTGLGHRLSEVGPADAHWSLHQGPPTRQRQAATAYAQRIAAFARATLAWSESQLVWPVTSSDLVYQWTSSPREGSYVLPQLEFDVDFVFAAGGIAVARLNEPGIPLRLSGPEFALLLLFDGRTSASEAISALGDRAGGPLTEDEISSVATLAIGAGICVGS